VGAIASIPISVLRPTGQSERVVDRFSVTFLLFFSEVQLPVLQWNGSFDRAFVIGNPKGEDIFWKLEDIPQAEVEARYVAKKYKTAPVIGANATTVSFIERAKEADLIYIAAHALAGGGRNEDPLRDSYIALADGKLTAATISRLPLKARLVVLSACQTGLGRVTEGAVVGLARIFLDAGSTNTLMTLWNVNDETTRVLMSEFVDLLPRHAPPEALRLAQIKARERFPEAVYWAAFNAFGMHSWERGAAPRSKASQGGSINKSSGTNVATAADMRTEVGARLFKLQETFNGNSGALTVIAPTQARLGEKIEIKINSSVSGHLILFDLSELQSASQIGPNSMSRNAWKVMPGESKSYVLRATEPIGKGSLVAIVIPDESVALSIGGSKAGLEPQFSTIAYLDDLIREVSRLLAKSISDGQTPAEKFAFAQTKYEIVR
jgi:hypothetical protein